MSECVYRTDSECLQFCYAMLFAVVSMDMNVEVLNDRDTRLVAQKVRIKFKFHFINIFNKNKTRKSQSQKQASDNLQLDLKK